MKSAEEMVRIIQKEEQQIWKAYLKARKEGEGKYKAMEEHLIEQHNAIMNLMDELEIERLK